MPIEIELISEPLLIPVWFYSYSAVIYFASALTSFLIAAFSYRLYKMSKFKLSLPLMFSFLLLGLAFSALTATSVYTYLYKPYFKDFFSLGLVNSIGFNFYYITSLLGYALILLMYLPEKIKKNFFVLYVPLWYINLMSFHVVSIVLLAGAAITNVINFYRKRNLDTFLVMFAFVTLVFSHLFMMMVPFDATVFLAANALIAVGFSSLLFMLIRVSWSDRKKI